LLQRLSEVQSTPVCLAKVVDDAKTSTIKLRINLRGYVTAGQKEVGTDPVLTPSFRPASGEPTYWPAAEYFLYECVVETCQAK
jgi:hypothetical protein